jgi:hypothetical protein
MITPITHQVITQAIAWSPLPRPLIHQLSYHEYDTGLQEAYYRLNFLKAAVLSVSWPRCGQTNASARAYVRTWLLRSFCEDISLLTVWCQSDSIIVADISYTGRYQAGAELSDLDWLVD